MMFVMQEKEEVSPGPRDLQSPKGQQSPKESQSPKDQQSPRGLGSPIELQSPKNQESPREYQSPKNQESPREFQSPKDYHTPKNHDTYKYYDDICHSPKIYLTPKVYLTPKFVGEYEDFFNDGQENNMDDEIPRSGAPGENIKVVDDDDDAAFENDEISGEEDADGDITENDEIGGGDADADLVDSLLQDEEDDDLDEPDSQEHHNEGNKQEAFTIEMKMRKKKALLEFRCKVEDAIRGNYISGDPFEPDDTIEVALEKEKLREITMWGIPLLPSKSHLGSDTVLLKFLKARDFKVDEAYDMLQKTVIWRKNMNVEGIMEEDLETEDLLQVAYTNSTDKKGHPLCYNLFGPFRNREMYNKVLGTEAKRDLYLRWRIQCMEKAIRQLSFKPGNIDSIVLITDLGNSPGPALKELRTFCKHLIILFQDYYPEFVYRNLVINVPFWYYISHAVHSRFASQGTKKRFIFARPSKATDTLLKYINAENLPIQHGGLQRKDDPEFTSEDKAKLLNVKPNSIGKIQVPVSEAGMTVWWEVTVVGWEVSYKEEFVPLDEGSYTVHIQNEKRLTECARNFFHIREQGNIVLSFQNLTSKKKKVFYRTKCSPTPTICPNPDT